MVRTLEIINQLNGYASDSGCIGDYEGESCWSAKPTEPQAWCIACLAQEAPAQGDHE